MVGNVVIKRFIRSNGRERGRVELLVLNNSLLLKYYYDSFNIVIPFIFLKYWDIKILAKCALMFSLTPVRTAWRKLFFKSLIDKIPMIYFLSFIVSKMINKNMIKKCNYSFILLSSPWGVRRECEVTRWVRMPLSLSSFWELPESRQAHNYSHNVDKATTC